MKGEDGQLQLSSNTASTKAANAYINGQLTYADAIAKGVNTAKVAAREGIEGTRELVSQGIYYSYNPTQAKVVRTAVQGIEHGLKPITEITYKQYAQGVAMGATASAITQYAATGYIDANKTIRTGLLAPYLLNAPLGTSVLIGSVDTAVSTISDGKSHLNEQAKYAESVTVGNAAEKAIPSPMKFFAPYIGIITGESINRLNEKLDKEVQKNE